MADDPDSMAAMGMAGAAARMPRARRDGTHEQIEALRRRVAALEERA